VRACVFRITNGQKMVRIAAANCGNQHSGLSIQSSSGAGKSC
jgi:hypothetical protein